MTIGTILPRAESDVREPLSTKRASSMLPSYAAATIATAMAPGDVFFLYTGTEPRPSPDETVQGPKRAQLADTFADAARRLAPAGVNGGLSAPEP